jgi:predicted ATPase
MNTTRGPEIVGRDREVSAATQFVADATSGSAALVICGAAGIGKTVLWRLAVDEERAAGYTVLTARPAEEEILGALTGLVDPLDLSGVDLSILEPGTDPFSRSRSLLSAIRRLAADAPVVVAIDDLQWLDVDTKRTLGYTFRRLDVEPVRLVATWRSEVGDAFQVCALELFGSGRLVSY